MMQVQQTICVDSDGACTFQINVLAREDATDAERDVALAVESYLIIVMQEIARQTGTTVEYIGSQHATPESEATP